MITVFWKNPLRANFQKIIPKGFTMSQNHVLCANFVKFGSPEIGKVVHCLPDEKNKTSARSPALASAQIAPKICQGQLQTVYSEFPKFHPNPFTSGGVIAECVNIIETCHKVFPILGKASSPSNNGNKCITCQRTCSIRRPRVLNRRISCCLLVVVQMKI